MTIIRTYHDKQNPYTILNNQVLFDPTISNAARGLWAQCMARKDDWVFYMSEMINNTRDGKDALYTQINELIQSGYAARIQIKEKKNGKLIFKSVDYIFFESKITAEKKAEFLENFKKEFNHCEFLEPKPKKDKENKEKEIQKISSQPAFPDTEVSDTENPPLLNTDRENTDSSNTNLIIDPPKTEPPKKKAMPAGGNNNFYKCLDKCEDLTVYQKGLLMKYAEPLVEQAIKYAYHSTTQLEGDNARIKQLQAFCKNPDKYAEKMRNLDKPKERKPKKDVVLGRFKRNEIYNGYEFTIDDIGVGFHKKGLPQPYSVRWDSQDFTTEFIEILDKLGIEP